MRFKIEKKLIQHTRQNIIKFLDQKSFQNEVQKRGFPAPSRHQPERRGREGGVTQVTATKTLRTNPTVAGMDAAIHITLYSLFSYAGTGHGFTQSFVVSSSNFFKKGNGHTNSISSPSPGMKHWHEYVTLLSEQLRSLYLGEEVS